MPQALFEHSNSQHRFPIVVFFNLFRMNNLSYFVFKSFMDSINFLLGFIEIRRPIV